MARPLLLGCIFFLLLLPGANAQVRIGPKVGIQASRIRFAEAEYRTTHESHFRPGLLGGLMLNYKVNNLYSLHSELTYSQNRRRVERVDPFRGKVTTSATYDYLNLPIMLRLSGHKRIKQNHLEYYINIGPSFNYWLGGRGKISSDEIQEFTGQDPMKYTIVFAESEGDYLNKMYVANPHRLQMSLDFGGGVIFDLGFHNHITVDLRSSLGIGKTYMGEKDGGDFGLNTYADNMEAVNHSFALSVGYLRDFDLMALFVKGRSKR